MSVTISPDILGLVAHLDGDPIAQRAVIGSRFPREYAEDEDGSYPTGYRVDLFELNVSNVNFAVLWGELGWHEPDWVGSMPAGELFDRVVTATALVETDLSSETVVRKAPGGPTMIECGRPRGYLQEKLRALAQVARQAMDLGVGVVWT